MVLSILSDINHYKILKKNVTQSMECYTINLFFEGNEGQTATVDLTLQKATKENFDRLSNQKNSTEGSKL